MKEMMSRKIAVNFMFSDADDAENFVEVYGDAQGVDVKSGGNHVSGTTTLEHLPFMLNDLEEVYGASTMEVKAK